MKNGEILFLYDATLSNPNGDPDDENRPRMDYDHRRNLVSDVRLKRYIRDYLADQGYDIYVAKSEHGEALTATKRLENLLGGRKPSVADLPKILERLMDIRLFGATMPIKGDKVEKGGKRGDKVEESGEKGKEKGESIQVTGPVQFTWGQSLNKVDLVSSYTISSRFKSEEGKTQGTFGKDYRVFYSFVGFAGVISGRRAAYAQLSERDLELLDAAMVRAIPLQATRSKIGQYPRLYLRIMYRNPDTVLGDWRNTVRLRETEGLRGIEDAQLVVDSLLERMETQHARIERVFYWQDPQLKLVSKRGEGLLGDLVSDTVRKLMDSVPVTVEV